MRPIRHLSGQLPKVIACVPRKAKSAFSAYGRSPAKHKRTPRFIPHTDKGEKDAQKGLRRFVNAQIEKDEALQALCDKKNVVLLAFVGSSMPRTGDPMSSARASISIVDEFGMEDALNQIQQGISKTKTKKAYLPINSFGGLERSSFKMAQAIRDTFDDITVFVPNIASSGGALLALTGDRIRMGMMSQLGPVDPQTEVENVPSGAGGLIL